MGFSYFFPCWMTTKPSEPGSARTCGQEAVQLFFLADDGHLGARDLCRKSSLPRWDNDAQIAGSHRRLILRILSALACFVSCCGGLLLVASIILNASHFVRNVSGPASKRHYRHRAGWRKNMNRKMCRHAACRRKCTGIKIKDDRRFTSSHL